MDSLRRFLGYSPAVSSPRQDAADDDIYPVFLLDDTKADGKSELRVPRVFSSERPAVKYSHTSYEVAIEEHAIGSRFPRPRSHPHTEPITEDFHGLVATENAALYTTGLESSDDPLLSLHVASFTNATIVTVAWPHILMDVAGQVALMKSWSSVLAGSEDEIIPCEDPLSDVTISIENESGGRFEKNIVEDSKMSFTSRMICFGRLYWEMLTLPERELRIIFLPRESVDRLLASVRTNLAEHDKDAYLTEGDIMSAWATKIYARSIASSRPVSVCQIVGARARIPSLATSKGIHVQNILSAALVFLSAELARSSLSRIALFHRKRFAEQTTEPQVRSMLHENIESFKQGKPLTLLCGPSNAGLLPVNNLNKIDYFGIVDFGPAVLKQGQDENSRTNPPGTMISWYNRPLDPKTKFGIDQFHIYCRDHVGNAWLGAAFRPGTWRILEAELKTM